MSEEKKMMIGRTRTRKMKPNFSCSARAPKTNSMPLSPLAMMALTKSERTSRTDAPQLVPRTKAPRPIWTRKAPRTVRNRIARRFEEASVRHLLLHLRELGREIARVLLALMLE